MRMPYACLALSLLLTGSGLADADTAKIEKDILDQIMKNTTVTATEIKDPSLTKFFSAKVYEAKTRVTEGNSTSSQGETWAATKE